MKNPQDERWERASEGHRAHYLPNICSDIYKRTVFDFGLAFWNCFVKGGSCGYVGFPHIWTLTSFSPPSGTGRNVVPPSAPLVQEVTGAWRHLTSPLLDILEDAWPARLELINDLQSHAVPHSHKHAHAHGRCFVWLMKGLIWWENENGALFGAVGDTTLASLCLSCK